MGFLKVLLQEVYGFRGGGFGAFGFQGSELGSGRAPFRASGLGCRVWGLGFRVIESLIEPYRKYGSCHQTANPEP